MEELSLWVAREKEGDLYLFKCTPSRHLDMYWDSNKWYERINNKLFPDLTWNDEPIEVELIIKKK